MLSAGAVRLRCAAKIGAPRIEGTAKVGERNTPAIYFGDRRINNNYDVVDEIKRLKQQDGPDIQVHGSGNLIQTLLEHDLIDELWLKIFPVTLGTGKRLFGNGTIPAAYTVVESKTTPSGVIIATFKRAGELKTGAVPE